MRLLMFRSDSQRSSYKAPEHHAILSPISLLLELVSQGTGGGEAVGEEGREEGETGVGGPAGLFPDENHLWRPTLQAGHSN